MTETVSRLLALVTLMAGFHLALAAPADAFSVRACGDAAGGVNRSWISTSSGPITTFDDCLGVGAYSGLSVYELLGGPPHAADGDYGSWTFAAPEGTVIATIRYGRLLRAYVDSDWKPEIWMRGLDSTVRIIETCTFSGYDDECSRGEVGGTERVTQALSSATSISIGGRCATAYLGSCERGATLHSLEAVLYGATFTLNDTEQPVLNAEPISDLSGGWRNAASGSIAVDATDNTGVRARRVYVGGRLVRAESPTVTGGCQDLNGDAYTYLRPCAAGRGLNGSRSTSLGDLSSWGSGTHSVQLGIVDTDGNETRTSPLTVRLDFDAPPAPSLTVVGGSGWSRHDAREVAWTVVSETDRSPVTSIDVEVCGPVSGCTVRTDGGAAFGAALSRNFAVAEGATSVRVRHNDGAGNMGTWSRAAWLLRDSTAPELSSFTVPAALRTGDRIDFSATAIDAHSGMSEMQQEVEIDGGAWRPYILGVEAQAGATYRFRARGIDRVGNVSAWRVSDSVTVPSPPEPIAGSTPDPATPPGPSADPTVGPVPSATRSQRRPTGLRIRTASLRGARVDVAGVRTRTATGRLTITYVTRRGGRAYRTRRSVHVSARGRFATTLQLSWRSRASRRGTVTVRYAGDSEHAPAAASRAVARQLSR